VITELRTDEGLTGWSEVGKNQARPAVPPPSLPGSVAVAPAGISLRCLGQGPGRASER
jgi:hypothetical protein